MYFFPGVKRDTDEEIDFGDFKIFDDENNVYSSTNFVYENIQFERMTQLTEFNTLLCMETIKQELAKVVQVKKENIARRQLDFSEVAAILSRVKSVRHSKRRSGLQLNIAPDRELRLMNMLKNQERQQSSDSPSDTSDYSDALEFQSDTGSQTTVTWSLTSRDFNISNQDPIVEYCFVYSMYFVINDDNKSWFLARQCFIS